MQNVFNVLIGINTLSEEATLSKLFCFPSGKSSTVGLWKKILSFRVDPFSEGRQKEFDKSYPMPRKIPQFV